MGSEKKSKERDLKKDMFEVGFVDPDSKESIFFLFLGRLLYILSSHMYRQGRGGPKCRGMPAWRHATKVVQCSITRQVLDVKKVAWRCSVLWPVPADCGFFFCPRCCCVTSWC